MVRIIAVRCNILFHYANQYANQHFNTVQLAALSQSQYRVIRLMSFGSFALFSNVITILADQETFIHKTAKLIIKIESLGIYCN